MYQRSPLASNINITTVSGVTIVGDGNVVNTGATDLTQVLDDLRKAVVQSDDYDDRTKLEVAADIDTIQSQIQKPHPDKSILSRAWEGIKNAVTVGEAVELAVKAGDSDRVDHDLTIARPLTGFSLRDLPGPRPSHRTHVRAPADFLRNLCGISGNSGSS